MALSNSNSKTKGNLINLEPRKVVIIKSETGYGFNVRGQICEGGQLKSINGELYAPMQHISAILPGGSAEKAGILVGDRILEVNETNVEGASHKQVVELIKACGDRLTLTVISLDPRRIRRLSDTSSIDYPSSIPQGEPYNHHQYPSGTGPIRPSRSAYNYEDPTEDVRYARNGQHPSTLTIPPPPLCYDYTEKRSLPISIADYSYIDTEHERFIVFNIHMARRHLCSRRYSEFSNLHSALKREFFDYRFPKFPSKWPFTLSDHQLDSRRRQLEYYLEQVCSIRVIAESVIMQDFLSDEENQNSNRPSSLLKIDLKILLPDQSIVCLPIYKNFKTPEVYQLLAEKIGLKNHKYFALFEIMEPDFERKLRQEEMPYSLYVQNYTTSSPTCILLKKWLFNLELEKQILDSCNSNSSQQTVDFLYWQALDQLSRFKNSPSHPSFLNSTINTVQNGDTHGENGNDRANFLRELISTLPNCYNCVTFPHCASDSRRKQGGHVTVITGPSGISLVAVDTEGGYQGKTIEFPWDRITKTGLIFNTKQNSVIDLDRSYDYKVKSEDDAKLGVEIFSVEDIYASNSSHLSPDHPNFNIDFNELIFVFRYLRDEANVNAAKDRTNHKCLKTVRIFSSYSLYMAECCERIKAERDMIDIDQRENKFKVIVDKKSESGDDMEEIIFDKGQQGQNYEKIIGDIRDKGKKCQKNGIIIGDAVHIATSPDIYNEVGFFKGNQKVHSSQEIETNSELGKIPVYQTVSQLNSDVDAASPSGIIQIIEDQNCAIMEKIKIDEHVVVSFNEAPRDLKFEPIPKLNHCDITNDGTFFDDKNINNPDNIEIICDKQYSPLEKGEIKPKLVDDENHFSEVAPKFGNQIIDPLSTSIHPFLVSEQIE
ncbi:unnamed protein product [Gordionus sp. m RMFG-2023]|uniref:uncharacterized protein LOC135931511 n=1 Tax=Gordionus sp. m RMFG-2023 TaxID=3053472 RepID=UPI0030E0F19E